jgi:hypothetical protein
MRPTGHARADRAFARTAFALELDTAESPILRPLEPDNATLVPQLRTGVERRPLQEAVERLATKAVGCPARAVGEQRLALIEGSRNSLSGAKLAHRRRDAEHFQHQLPIGELAGVHTPGTPASNRRLATATSVAWGRPRRRAT